MSRSEVLTVTATDQAGHQTSKTVTLNWTDPTPRMQVGVTWPGRFLGGTGGQVGPWTALHFYMQASGGVPAWPATAYEMITFTDTLGGPGWSGNSSNVAQCRANLAAIPDKPNTGVNDFHEPEDNYGRTTAGGRQYNADAVVFGQQVDLVNAGRVNKLTWFQQFQGGSLTGNNNPASMLGWIVPRADEVGFDVYGPNQVPAAIAFAAQIGKPLVIPEMGPLTNVDHTDAAILAYMQAAFPLYRAAGVVWVTWFNKLGAGGDLTQYPRSLAYLLTQINFTLAA